MPPKPNTLLRWLLRQEDNRDYFPCLRLIEYLKIKGFQQPTTYLNRMKKVPETKIGNLQVPEGATQEAYLHCYCAEASLLNMDVLNEQGKTYRSIKKPLGIGPHKITIKTGHLPAGRYNAWINLGQVSAIRSFSISKPDTFSDRLKDWFKK